MKKFKYKVEAYLKFLIFQRENQLKEVNKAREVKKQLEDQYLWMESEMKKAYQTNSQFGKSATDIRYIEDNNKFMNILKTQMRSLSEEIAIADENYQNKYKKLLELQLKVKKMEMHKEQKKEEHKKEKMKREQKQLDEINSTRRGRNAESL